MIRTTGRGAEVDRYKVVDGSQSVHCCFSATVVDTTRPLMIGGEQWKDEFVQVCECLDREDAELIATALNKLQGY